MQRLLRIGPGGLLVVLALIVASAALGFAHRAPVLREEAVRALALAGIAPGDVCGGLPGAVHAPDCPACHIAGAMPVPVAQGLVRPAGWQRIGRRVSEAVAPVRRVRDPALGGRAPPAA